MNDSLDEHQQSEAKMRMQDSQQSERQLKAGEEDPALFSYNKDNRFAYKSQDRSQIKKLSGLLPVIGEVNSVSSKSKTNMSLASSDKVVLVESNQVGNKKETTIVMQTWEKSNEIDEEDEENSQEELSGQKLQSMMPQLINLDFPQNEAQPIPICNQPKCTQRTEGGSSPLKSRDANEGVKSSKTRQYSIDSVDNNFEVLKYKFDSRASFLLQLSLKNMKRNEKVLFTIAFFLSTLYEIGIDAQNQIQWLKEQNKTIKEFNYFTLEQQLVAFVVVMVSLHINKLNKMYHKIPFFLIGYLMIALQIPIYYKTVAERHISMMRWTLLQLTWVFLFTPIFEVSFIVLLLIVLNWTARMELNFEPQYGKSTDPSDQHLSLMVKLANSVLLLLTISPLFFYQLHIELLKHRAKERLDNASRKATDEFDLENEGIMNCDDFKEHTQIKNVLNGVPYACGFLDSNKLMSLGKPKIEPLSSSQSNLLGQTGEVSKVQHFLASVQQLQHMFSNRVLDMCQKVQHRLKDTFYPNPFINLQFQSKKLQQRQRESRNSEDNVKNLRRSPSPLKFKNQNLGDEPFTCLNKQMKDFLMKISPKLEEAIEIPLFYIYHFDKLPFDPTCQDFDKISIKSSTQNQSLFLPSGTLQSFEETQTALSLRQILQQVINQEHSTTWKVMVRFRTSHNTPSLQGVSDTQSGNKQENLVDFLKNDSNTNICWQPKTYDELKVIQKNSEIVRATQNKEINALKNFEYSIAEISIMPIYFKEQTHYQIQFQMLNHTAEKLFKLVLKNTLNISNPPTGSEETLTQLNQIAKNSQLIEQVICQMSNNQSRTSILDRDSSSSHHQTGNMNISQQAFQKIQINMSTIWASAVQLANSMKVAKTRNLIQKKKFNLCFQKISSKSMSIENHVKQFLLTFQPQIESKNIFVTVKQGQMPDHDLYTDWRLYDLILFQILKSSIENNVDKGAIAVIIYFMKERKQMNNLSSQDTEQHQDTGKIVTVLKYTRVQESNPRLIQSDPLKITGLEQRNPSVSDNKIKNIELDSAEVMCGCLGGKIVTKSRIGQDCYFQITFDVMCTSYGIKELALPRQSEKSLQLPLQKKRKLSEAAMMLKSSQQSYGQVSYKGIGDKEYYNDNVSNGFKYITGINEILEKISEPEEVYRPLEPSQELYQFEEENISKEEQMKMFPQDQTESLEKHSGKLIMPNEQNSIDSNVQMPNLKGGNYMEQGWGSDPLKNQQKSREYPRLVNCLADALRLAPPENQQDIDNQSISQADLVMPDQLESNHSVKFASLRLIKNREIMDSREKSEGDSDKLEKNIFDHQEQEVRRCQEESKEELQSQKSQDEIQNMSKRLPKKLLSDDNVCKQQVVSNQLLPLVSNDIKVQQRFVIDENSDQQKSNQLSGFSSQQESRNQSSEINYFKLGSSQHSKNHKFDIVVEVMDGSQGLRLSEHSGMSGSIVNVQSENSQRQSIGQSMEESHRQPRESLQSQELVMPMGSVVREREVEEEKEELKIDQQSEIRESNVSIAWSIGSELNNLQNEVQQKIEKQTNENQNLAESHSKFSQILKLFKGKGTFRD